MTAAQYARMIRALLPPGRLWRRDPDAVTDAFWLAAADELERVDGRGEDLIRESDPRQADELLPEFEAELDIVAEGTLEERRARVVARLVARQRYRPADFQQALAPLFGQDAEDVVIIERSATQAATMGDLDGREIFRFFAYRNPSDPGSYNIEDAQDLIDQIKPSHTAGYAIESIDFLCDDEFSLCDRDLLGV